MGQLRGLYEIECFITNDEMEDKEFPEENTETFHVELGTIEYLHNQLQDLHDRMKVGCDYYFDVAKFANALHHLREMDGFLNNGVLVSEGIGGSYKIPVEYRTDRPYPLRVRISKNGWYAIAPCMDQDVADDCGLKSGAEGESGE